MRGIRLWWRQPDHYDWLTGYLAARGLTDAARYILAGILTLLAAATLLMRLSPAGPATIAERVASDVVTAVLIIVAVGYVWRWPDRRRSEVFSLLGTVALAGACLADSDPRAGLLGCAAFIGLAGYVGFFHSPRYLTITLAISLATATACAVRIASEGDPAMALSKLMVMTGAILAVPFCGQVLVNWLSVDALRSSIDALTGLRNRRGFHRAARDLLTGAAGDPDRSFTVVMVDLDAFKQANDTYGHAVGDMILIAVADSLRKAAGDDAVVGRIGGEEFLVAAIAAPGALAENSERLRAAIAATSWNITASLGVSSTGLTRVAETPRDLIDGLIAAADTAMYEAKRAGGNRIHFADTPMSRLS
ncbi:GGDEF domain-containing protein [Mycolicibacterium sp. F2034L]|uniref:GGDEF domain-containing protein n=1 Tax=Mycolicibacterium sp. F2034L TaxID=2926422 RepID=UPI001FF51583|nr:GGDEF domain-containing protein [Mycolicibacterium sp. F2034L]MCK0175378.1 GGDEF domain-containing protein [Mycolicibacterium sp. F2034L]